MIELNENQKAKVQHFLADKMMSDTIYEVLLDSFLTGQPKDVYVLAASRLAVDYLKNGWKELKNYRPEERSEEAKLKQVGL